MGVYVDPLVSYSGRLWSHMATDGDLSELHEMAARIGLKRCWFQNKRGRNRPHYDVTQAKRDRAIRSGSIPVDHAELFQRCFREKNEAARTTA